MNNTFIRCMMVLAYIAALTSVSINLTKKESPNSVSLTSVAYSHPYDVKFPREIAAIQGTGFSTQRLASHLDSDPWSSIITEKRGVPTYSLDRANYKRPEYFGNDIIGTFDPFRLYFSKNYTQCMQTFISENRHFF